MFKVIVTKNEKTIAEFIRLTEEIANAEIAKIIKNNSWGKPDRWLTETDGTHTTSREIEIEIGSNMETITEYFFPKEYSYTISDITAQHLAEQSRNARIETSKKVRALCDNILDLIAGFNLERNLTAEQITSLEGTFSNIQTLLLNKRPFSAKTLIQAITPDGVLVTEEIKASILNEYVVAGMDNL